MLFVNKGEPNKCSISGQDHTPWIMVKPMSRIIENPYKTSRFPPHINQTKSTGGSWGARSTYCTFTFLVGKSRMRILTHLQ